MRVYEGLRCGSQRYSKGPSVVAVIAVGDGSSVVVIANVIAEAEKVNDVVGDVVVGDRGDTVAERVISVIPLVGAAGDAGQLVFVVVAIRSSRPAAS